MDTKRVQLDLTEAEHAEMERLSAMAGLRTKREFVTNALTLFRWASNELLADRIIGSAQPDGTMLKQLEMPCLIPFAAAGREFAKQRPSDEELLEREKGPGIPDDQFWSQLRQRLEAIDGFQDRILAEGHGKTP